MALYKSYSFRTKDPVIDLLRTAIQLEADAIGVKFSRMCHNLEVGSGVKAQTMYNWFTGPTISPRYCCVAAVANCLRTRWRVGDRVAVVSHKRKAA